MNIIDITENCELNKEDIKSSNSAQDQFQKKGFNKFVNFKPQANASYLKVLSPQNNQRMFQEGLVSKSPLKNPLYPKHQFEEYSMETNVPLKVVQNKEKRRQQQQLKIESAIEMTANNFQQSFSQAYKNYDKNKKNITIPSNVELTTENDNQRSDQLEEYDNETMPAETTIKCCRFCLQTSKQYRSKSGSSNNLHTNTQRESDEEDENNDDDDDQEEEEKINSSNKNYVDDKDDNANNDQEDEQEKKDNVKKNKNARIDEFVIICRCERNQWAHKTCLINRTINNKFKCRACMSVATFLTKKNWSYDVIKMKYKIRYKEVSGIFKLFAFTVMCLIAILLYMIYLLFTCSDVTKIFIWIGCTLSVVILFLYGLVFFLKSANKLCITEISSDIQIDDLIEKKKENLMTEKRSEIYEGNNNILYTGHEECFTYYQDRHERLSIQSLSVQNKQMQMAKKVISPLSQDSKRFSFNRIISANSNQAYAQVSNTSTQNPKIVRRFNQRPLTCLPYQTSQIKMPYAKQLYNSQESEQSPHTRKASVNTLTKNGHFQKNSSSSNSNSNDGNKSFSQIGSALSERNRQPSYFQLQFDLSKQNFNNNNNNNNKINNNQNKQQQNSDGSNSGLRNRSVRSNGQMSRFDNDSNYSKKQNAQQTSRFGDNITGSNLRNITNLTNQQHPAIVQTTVNKSNMYSADYILKNLGTIKQKYVITNNINEESLNTSSINTNNNKSRQDNESDNQATKPSLQSDTSKLSPTEERNLRINEQQTFPILVQV